MFGIRAFCRFPDDGACAEPVNNRNGAGEEGIAAATKNINLLK